ncbi:MAG: energy transducer TonB [Gammaproteobacteria bacterium]
MYLFKERENALSHRDAAPLAGPSATFMPITLRSFCDGMTGEERPATMLGLLLLLVLLLHVWVLRWLMPSAEPHREARPLIMEVALLAAAQQQAAPAQQPPAPPPAKKIDVPQKPKAKPILKPLPKKKPPRAEKKPELPRIERRQEAQAVTEAPSAPLSKAPAAVTAPKAPAPVAEKFTEANFRANYRFNPKPEYPRLARKRGWQGKVLLKVQVSAQGYSDAVAVHRSSGHEMLDESAVEAVKKWQFIPAKRGETPVASSVIVPIIFKFDN